MARPKKEDEVVDEAVATSTQDRARLSVEARVKFDKDKLASAGKDLPKVGSTIDYKEKNGSIAPAIVCGKVECRVREDGSFEGSSATTTATQFGAFKLDEWGRTATEWRAVAWVMTHEASAPYKVIL